MDKLLKIIAVNLGSLVFGILFLVLFMLSLARHTLLAWLWLLLFFLVLATWIGGNLMIFRKKKELVYEEGALHTFEEYQRALMNLEPKCFGRQIQESETQLERLAAKREQISDALSKYFGGSKISYTKYMNTVDNLISVFLSNLQKIINRITLFDDSGYRKLTISGQEYSSAFSPYKASISYVNQKIEENETILSTLDHLMLEIAKLNDSPKALEDMSAMREIEELIQNTRLYKHE